MDRSDEEIVVEVMHLLGCDLRGLLLRACTEKRIGRNSLEHERNAKAAYRRFQDGLGQAAFLIEFCHDVLLRESRDAPARNIFNFAAHSHGVIDISTRRKPPKR